jgi:glycosyltransferase involved in cell wall biosynthesis
MLPSHLPTTQSSADQEHRTANDVAILLCTFNGAPYLHQQLDSFDCQTHSSWNLHISDDNSTDGTQEILERHALEQHRDYKLYAGPCKGFAANFMSLIKNTAISANFYSYADQDDIWEPKKLERALEILKQTPRDVPALYFSRTAYIDSTGELYGFSMKFDKAPCFKNALVQSIGGGNTMVFNHAARNLLIENSDLSSSISHDWWTYLVVAAAGGSIFYDPEPLVRYRQHGKNAAGQNITLLARLNRVRQLFNGRYKQWNSQHIAALRAMETQVTTENRQTLEAFSQARSGHFIARIYWLHRSKVFRQPYWNQWGLYVAALFKKL